jgi:protein TonB
MSGPTPIVVIASAALHGLFVAAALFGDRGIATAPPMEIPVEIVQIAPLPPRPAPKAQVKPALSEPAPPKPAASNSGPQPSAVPRAASAPIAQKLPAPREAAPTPEANQAADLQKQLAELKAQRAALAAEAATAAPEAAQGQAGPLAGSMQAVALPSTGEDASEIVSYQSLVFSQLAKAKGVGEYHGAAGTTGVRFEIDSNGKLLGVDVETSSGNAALDKDAVDIVKRAAPFPTPPKDAEHKFFANVNFVPAKS